MKKIVLSIIALISTLAAMSVLEAQAIGFGISPVRFELEMNPGDTLEQKLKIINNGPAVMAEFVAQDFVAKDESGAPQILPEGEAHSSYSLASWIELPDEIFLEENASTDVVFKINVPFDAEPGGHYGAILVQQKGTENQNVATVSRIGPIVLLKVSGEAEVAISLDSFAIPSQGISDEAVIIETRLKNAGNVHLKPKGKIFIYDETGKQLEKIGHQNILDGNGIVIRTEDIDYLPFNTLGLSMLPDQTRKFETTWNQGAYRGKFGAKIEVQYSDSKEMLTSEDVEFEIHEELSPRISLKEESDQWFVNPPLVFEVNLNNIGNVLLKPEAEIKVYNYFGAEKNVLPVQFKKKKLAGGESETVDVSWDEGAFGPYIAKLFVRYGPADNRQEITIETHFTVATTARLFGIAFAVMLVIFFIVWLVARYLKIMKLLKKMRS